MDINIGIISRETIQPSSPTPQSLSKYQISFLDQIAPPYFLALVYFYPSHATVSNSERLNDLKKSLSQVLTKFYPLAGRLVDNQYVDCNDEGAPFVEAEADCDLTYIMEKRNPHHMNRFCPYAMDDIQDLCMAVQVTSFHCGGIAVGLVISHKVADALSFFKFANSWAMSARDGNPDAVTEPKFDTATIFPPQDASSLAPNKTNSVKENIVTKIFTFHESKISALRDVYGDVIDTKLPIRRPSRIAVLSTFIWTRFISSTKSNLDQNKTFAMLLPINLRTRFDPPLSADCFGNVSQVATVVPRLGEGGAMDCGYDISQKVMEAIRGVNGEYVARVKEADEFLDDWNDRTSQAIEGEISVLVLTSLSRFPYYEADFGWGEPVWVGSVSLPCENIVTFMDTATGDGIEAWVNLKKEDMEMFEDDLELQAFASTT